MSEQSFLRTITEVSRVITPIDSTIRFPEIVDILVDKYGTAIDTFCQLILESSSSADVLRKIRSAARDPDERMALLKMYRRCVSPVLDTETTKKIRKVDTETLIDSYGHTFKPISKLHQQFSALPTNYKFALAALVGEYDTRGQLGYQLTAMFFYWFEQQLSLLHNYSGSGGRG